MSGKASYNIIWEFTVAEEHRADFEASYGPSGSWAQLFRKGEGYIETQLLADEERVNVYLTIDRWVSREHFERFKVAYDADYRKLDEQLEGVAGSERSATARHAAARRSRWTKPHNRCPREASETFCCPHIDCRADAGRQRGQHPSLFAVALMRPFPGIATMPRNLRATGQLQSPAGRWSHSRQPRSDRSHAHP